MADEKPQDKKPAKKTSASMLYDHEFSKKHAGREDKPAAKPDAKADDDAKKPDAKPSADAAPANPADPVIEGLRTIHKLHESERADLHNNHREAMRQMHSRHEKALSTYMGTALGVGGASEDAAADQGVAPAAQAEA